MDARGLRQPDGCITRRLNMNINMRQNYSYLFSSMNTFGGNSGGYSGMAGLFGDYASIKNGSYGKLMKAYYTADKSESADKTRKSNHSNIIDELTRPGSTLTRKTVTKEDRAKLNKVETAADALKNSADALVTTGSRSVFREKEITSKDGNGVESTAKGYDTDAIYNAVNKFVTDYNSVLTSVKDADNANVNNRSAGMINNTAANEKSLNKIGISINTDGTLALNKDTFLKSDMGSVKSLFNGNGSYGYRVSAQASMIDYAAGREASKTNTYTVGGTYNTAFNSGNIYNNYF